MSFESKGRPGAFPPRALATHHAPVSRWARSFLHQHSARARFPPTRRSLKLLTKRWFIRAATQATEPRGELLARCSGPPPPGPREDASSSSRPEDDGGVRGRDGSDSSCEYRSPSSGSFLGQQPLRLDFVDSSSAGAAPRGTDESRRSVAVVVDDVVGAVAHVVGTVRLPPQPPLSLRGRPGTLEAGVLARTSAFVNLERTVPN